MSNFGLMLTALAALMTAAANLCFQQGVKQSSQLTEGIWHFISLFSNFSFLAGCLLYVLSLFTWLKILAIEPIGVAYPILIGLTFVLLIFGAAFFAHEHISLKMLTGSFLILAGITLIARA